MSYRKILFATVVLLGIALLAACATTQTPVIQEVTREVPVEVTRIVEVTPPGPAFTVPFEELWAASAHAKQDAEAFVHWNEESPAEVPENCAKCHSTTGYLDYIGADGSEVNVVNKPVPVGEVVSCEACHNPTTVAMSSVLFPSGAELTDLGPEARCMQCHQGRASTVQVQAAIEKAGLTDDDTPAAELGFVNIHYFAAAVSQFGTQVQGGFEYPGQQYDVKADHVEGYNTCVGCHNPHTLEVKVDECAACHTGVQTADDLKNIRMASSLVDYDGDGDTEEGIYFEIDGLREVLLTQMQAYANDVSKTAIAYTPDAYPYFFIDTNGNGTADEDEINSDNRFNAWTGRLEKAAFNYQTSLKDPGAFAHGPKYIIQLLYDSIADLNTKLASPVDMSKMHRIDAGHFAGSEEAFRHWDAEGEVPGTCAKCHSGTGLPTFIANNANIAVEPSNGLLCTTCHNDLATYTRFEVASVRFPSGATLTFGEENTDANLCLQCHQGRESTASVNSAIKAAGLGDDESSDKLRFRNVHYFAAGATLFGNKAQGIYEYAGQQYLGQFEHGGLGPTNCVQCHSTHGLEVEVDKCETCHQNVQTPDDLRSIRLSETDYDGDGDVTEGIAGELATYQETLYAALQTYAKDRIGKGIVYNAAAYPYFFLDADNDGQPDKDDKGASIGYNAFTPRLLRAAYNYQYSQKDPGAFTHNARYVIQALYDSIRDLGGNVQGMTRP